MKTLYLLAGAGQEIQLILNNLEQHTYELYEIIGKLRPQGRLWGFLEF